MRYTLRQLEIFLATAHHENLTRAADSLAMSQSAASGALKELEQQFDIQLFERIGKRLQLNDFGRVLQPRAEELLARARELESALGHDVEAGPLKVGATLSIGNYLAIPLLTRYMADQASRVSLEVANTATITHKVAHFVLDVGMIEGELHHPDLTIEAWRDDELVVFCAPGHPLAARRQLSDKDLLEARWILREPGSGTRQTFERGLHDLLPRLAIQLELQHTEAIKRAVESGLGLGCLSRITLEDAFASGRLVPLSVPGRDLRRKLYLILHKQKYHSAGVKRWLALCHQAA
ncbi:MAG: LysR family transcriptional regulator [Spongiibacteraceae bacterium]|jgi:DNA-binding transcriptional LysR family regulator|nr:LysR family transcriptional regulator [Spongiibacteraceae bacterium]